MLDKVLDFIGWIGEVWEYWILAALIVGFLSLIVRSLKGENEAFQLLLGVIWLGLIFFAIIISKALGIILIIITVFVLGYYLGRQRN